MTRIAIAGERGLVSRELQARLVAHPEIEVVVVPQDVALTAPGAALLADSDLAVLAVQDFASANIVGLLPVPTRVLDVSPAFRVDPAWVYGLAELPGQRARIAVAQRVANPGCFATSAILALAPLVAAGLLDAQAPVFLDAVGGYSTGGLLMEAKALSGELPAECVYGLAREHRHVPEIKRFAGLTGPVWFTPKIAGFARGIRMQVPVTGVARDQVLEALTHAYRGTQIIVDDTVPSKLPGDEWAGKPGACVRAIPHPGGTLVVCSLDNLGRGAVDSAYENLSLMLGCAP